MKNAVIVVHGISPQQRYKIQDEFAQGLCAALQRETAVDRAARLGEGAPPRRGSWSTGVAWPAVCKDQGLRESPVMALRVECMDDHAARIPCEPTIDVFEGYWSPIDKEETTPFRVLSWLFQSFFAPLSKATVPANLGKAAYDVICGGGAVAGGVLVTILLIASATRAFHENAHMVWADPIGLVEALLGAYLLAQVAARLLAFVTLQAKIALWGAVALGLLAFLALFLLGWWPLPGAKHESLFAVLAGPRGWLVFSAILLRSLLGFIRNFLVDTVGDIQIYTTHDENARYYRFREQIIGAVGDVVARVLRSQGDDGLPLYDRVVLAGHSLGTTVLMDVIVALHEQVEEEGLPQDAWRRIRAYLTFGTALEKTRFFFDVRNPDFSKTLVDWRKDIYGHLFTAQPAALEGPAPAADQAPIGIYWENYWYFTDVVANKIVSYTSSRLPGADLMRPVSGSEHAICVNVNLRPPLSPWPHSHYLSDDSFWHTGERLGAVALGAMAIVAHA